VNENIKDPMRQRSMLIKTWSWINETSKLNFCNMVRKTELKRSRSTSF